MTKVRADGDDLEFDFHDCPRQDIFILDELPGETGDTRCDFVVYPPRDPTLLIEVKDPCQPNATKTHRIQFLQSLRIHPNNPMETKLLHKAAMTIAFAQNERPDRNRLLILAVFGMECLEQYGILSDAELGIMQTSLLRRLRAIKTLSPVVEQVLLLTVSSWPKAIPQYPLRRISAGEVP